MLKTVRRLLRFLAGLGLGGCLPTAIALVTEHARAGRRGSATTVIMTGFHFGAVLTALLGIVVMKPLGWRAMFVIGAAPALVVVPLMLRHLPESGSFLGVARPRRSLHDVLGPVASLFRPGLTRPTSRAGCTCLAPVRAATASVGQRLC